VPFMFFWMLSPFDPSVTQTDWDNYLNYMAWTTILIMLIGVGSIVGMYAHSARRRKIHTPDDLFRPYRCMWWLLLSVPAGLGAAVLALVKFSVFCGEDAAGVAPAAISIGLETAFLCFVIGYLLILTPGVTPPVFKYRPRGWLFGPRRTATPSN
jgi:hypothetical protein